MPTKQCENDGCTNTFKYGIESRLVPKYCSFGCRDEAEPHPRGTGQAQ